MATRVKVEQTDDQKLRILQKRMKLSNFLLIAAGVCIALLVLLLIIGTEKLNLPGSITIVLVVLGLALFLGGEFLKKSVGERLKHVANQHAMTVLERVMDHIEEYDQSKHIERKYMRQDLGFPDYQKYGFCGDYVKGVLHGIPLEFSEFELQEEHVREDSDGETDRSYQTIFYGVMVVCRHALPISDAVTVTHFKTYEDGYMTGNEAFDHVYSVRCGQKQDADIVLTPEYMQSLLRISAEKGRRFGVCFTQDGTLLFAIKDMNLFETGKVVNAVQLEEKLTSELAELAHIIDVLALPAQRV